MYVERPFALVARGTAEDKKGLERHLKRLMANAEATNELWTHDWDREPLLGLR
jgi:hypothetical protein